MGDSISIWVLLIGNATDIANGQITCAAHELQGLVAQYRLICVGCGSGGGQGETAGLRGRARYREASAWGQGATTAGCGWGQ